MKQGEEDKKSYKDSFFIK